MTDYELVITFLTDVRKSSATRIRTRLRAGRPLGAALTDAGWEPPAARHREDAASY